MHKIKTGEIKGGTGEEKQALRKVLILQMLMLDENTDQLNAKPITGPCLVVQEHVKSSNICTFLMLLGDREV